MYQCGPNDVRDGYTRFELEDGTFILWKDCEIKSCVNQVCVNRSDRFCFPHSPADEGVAEMIKRNKSPERV